MRAGAAGGVFPGRSPSQQCAWPLPLQEPQTSHTITLGDPGSVHAVIVLFQPPLPRHSSQRIYVSRLSRAGTGWVDPDVCICLIGVLPLARIHLTVCGLERLDSRGYRFASAIFVEIQ